MTIEQIKVTLDYLYNKLSNTDYNKMNYPSYIEDVTELLHKCILILNNN